MHSNANLSMTPARANGAPDEIAWWPREATAIMQEIACAGRDHGRAGAQVRQTFIRLNVLVRRHCPPAVDGAGVLDAPAALNQALAVLTSAIGHGRPALFKMRVSDFLA